MSSVLYRIGRACYRRRGRVLVGWLLVMLVLAGATVSAKGAFDDSFEIPGASSQQALNQLRMTFPEAADATATMLITAPQGVSLTDPSVRTDVERAFALIEELPFVKGIQSPYNEHIHGQITPDGAALLAIIRVSGTMSTFSDAERLELQDAGQRAAALIPGAEVHLGGEVYSVHVPKITIVEGLGLVVAVIVLLVLLGSVRAAAMPVGTAVLGVALGALVTMIGAGVLTVSSTTLMLAVMLGLAVGIDYALFIVSRHRDQLAAGLEPEESAARAVATAGGAVVFAGLTVIVALAGLSLSGVPFLGVMGAFAAVTVAFEVALALTLLPAMLGYAGAKLTPRPRKARPASRQRTTLSQRWIRLVTAVPILTVVVVIAALGALAYPAKDLQLALPNSGRAEPTAQDRITFDKITAIFGPGRNGPLIVTGTIVESTDPLGVVEGIRDDILTIPGVEAITVATPNANADTALIQVIPTTGPDDPATGELVQRLRDRHDAWQRQYGIDTSITGATAVQIDVTNRLAQALVPFALFVVGLSFLLLMAVFRSIWVPLKAAAGYLLSVGGAFGATNLVFNRGWFKEAINLHDAQPVISFLPIIGMGILFGLAMDYEVFLVSRMREEFVHGNTEHSVRDGFLHSSKVVTAAALIMTSVFAFFVPSGEGAMKPIAFALALGVALDAFVVRMTLGPAVMKLLGKHAWWLPNWLDRRLPVLDIEGEALSHQLRYAEWPEADGTLIHAQGLTVSGHLQDQGLSVRPGEVLLVEGDPVSTRALLLAVGGRLAGAHGDVRLGGYVLPEQAAQVRRAAAVVQPRDSGALTHFTGPVLLIDGADAFTGQARHDLEVALASIAQSGDRAAIVTHAPGADLSDLHLTNVRELRLSKEQLHA